MLKNLSNQIRRKKIGYLIVSLSLLVLLWRVVSSAAGGGDNSGGDEVGQILLALIIILLAAKLGGDLLERVNQPAVLGELLLGIIIGNLYLTGFAGFEPFKHSVTLEILAELGVILLLFEVGLESSLAEMRKVGAQSFLVALFGIVAPFFLGWGVGRLLLPEESIYVHIFLGATLTATSVGITARVLKDIGKVQSRESRIILGAAVIDDILGLIILSVVVGIIGARDAGGAAPGTLSILAIIAKAFGFIIAAIIIGNWLMPKVFHFGSRLKVSGMLLTIALLTCFLLAFLAKEIGLAPIVGAFAAGLILDRVHYRDFSDRGELNIEEIISPIGQFLIPIFFVKMGMMVNLASFANKDILIFAAILTAAAIIGKQSASLAIFDKVTNRFAIGLGMIPRGEVGLIFAGIGAKMVLDGRPVISAGLYGAVVIMVFLTTLATPPLLKYSMRDRQPKPRPEPDRNTS